jgi:hypothetical protein
MDASGNCETCGAKITGENEETTPCPRCDQMRCEKCDTGKDVICPDCEEGK